MSATEAVRAPRRRWAAPTGRVRLVALVAASLLAATACSSAPPVVDDAGELDLAAVEQRSRDGGTASFRVTLLTEVEDVNRSVQGTGAARLDGSASRLVVNDAENTLSGTILNIGEDVFVNGVLAQAYVNDLPVGDWVQLTSVDLNQGVAATSTGQLSPSEMLAQFSTYRDPEAVGTEEIDGETATQYRVTFNAAEAAEAQGTDLTALAQRLEEQQALDATPEQYLEAYRSITGTALLWVGEQGRLRRIVQYTDLTPLLTVLGLGEAGTLGFTIEMDITGYGVEVDTEAPDPSTVHTPSP